MKLFLAVIIFSYFAVFAPNSHGDRPLLLGEPKIGQIQYSDFKLPIARLQQRLATLEESFLPLFLSQYFIPAENFVAPFTVFFLKQNYAVKNHVLAFHTSPLKFCEILQV